MNRSQYYKDYYRANQEHIRVYQYLYYRNNKREKDIKKVHCWERKGIMERKEHKACGVCCRCGWKKNLAEVIDRNLHQDAFDLYKSAFKK